MQAEKITLTIKIEVLSLDSIAGILQEVIGNIENEKTAGTLRWNDGDEVVWGTEKQPFKI